ncbi:hypothetical protein GQ457_07G022900 [Hibiscus cannabinus]
MTEATVASQLSLMLKASSSHSLFASTNSIAEVVAKPMASSLPTTASFRVFSSSSAARRSLLSFSSSLKSLAFFPLSFHFSRHQRGSAVNASTSGGFSSVASSKWAASYTDQLRGAREDIREVLKSKYCHPILVRLGWHDAGTYNKNVKEWPQRSGANGSLRFEAEMKYKSNTGLINALKLIQPIKDKYPSLTYADLFQLASATAVEEAGGPKIPMKYGRLDASSPDHCPEEGRLPAAGASSPADHLRKVFSRMGFNDKVNLIVKYPWLLSLLWAPMIYNNMQEIVALTGAHTLGRARPERSSWGKPETKYTKNGPGAPGGQSWTVQWLKFDNSYFKEIKAKRDEDLLVLPTDAVLFEDPSFKVYAEKYAEDEETFFKDFAEAHTKLSNLGAKFDPPEKFVGAKYSDMKGCNHE